MADAIAVDEVHEAEFQRFLDTMDLTEKTQSPTLDADDRKSFALNKETLIRAMRRGSLVIDEKGQPVFTPTTDTLGPITFKEPTGAVVRAMDQAKKGNDGEKGLILMSAITGQVQSRFTKMARRDLAVCEALVVLFLA